MKAKLKKDELLNAMAKRSMTRIQLVVSAGVSYNTINVMIGNPLKLVNMSTAQKVSKALGVDFKDIFLAVIDEASITTDSNKGAKVEQ